MFSSRKILISFLAIALFLSNCITMSVVFAGTVPVNLTAPLMSKVFSSEAVGNVTWTSTNTTIVGTNFSFYNFNKTTSGTQAIMNDGTDTFDRINEKLGTNDSFMSVYTNQAVDVRSYGKIVYETSFRLPAGIGTGNVALMIRPMVSGIVPNANVDEALFYAFSNNLVTSYGDGNWHTLKVIQDMWNLTNSGLEMFIDDVSTGNVGGTPTVNNNKAFVVMQSGGIIDNYVGVVPRIGIWGTDRAVDIRYIKVYGDTDSLKAPNSNSLVAQYKFNEDSGTTIVNSANNNTNGTLNAVSFVAGYGEQGWNSNNAINAGYFSGLATSYATIKSIGAGYNNSFTYSAWIKPTIEMSTLANTYFIGTSSSASTTTTVNFGINKGKVSAYWSGSTNYINDTAVVCDGNTWTHIAVVFSKNVLKSPPAAGLPIKFYVNGILSATKTVSQADLLAMKGPAPDLLGKSSISGLKPYKGAIDDLRIYNYALTDAEIKNIYKPDVNVTSFGFSNASGPISTLSGVSQTVTGSIIISNDGAGQKDIATVFALYKKDGEIYNLDKITSNSATVLPAGTLSNTCEFQIPAHTVGDYIIKTIVLNNFDSVNPYMVFAKLN